MNKFFKNFNQYGRASLWMEEAKLREAKKQALQALVAPQEEVVEANTNISLAVPHIVFLAGLNG